MKNIRSTTALLAAVAATSIAASAAVVAAPETSAAAPGQPVQTAPPAASEAPTAAPEGAVVVGPGSPIRMPFPDTPIDSGRFISAPSCSLGVPGTVRDENGNEREVILTAGHCLEAEREIGVGPKVTGDVYVPTPDGDILIGTADVVNMGDIDDSAILGGPIVLINSMFNQADYAFIRPADGVEVTSISESRDEYGQIHGEPVQMVGVVDRRTLQPYEIAVDNFGEPICSDGMRTGRNCGYQVFRARHGVWAVGMGIDHGDSGGNAYDPRTNEVIGVTSMGVGPLSRFQAADVAIEEAYGIEDGKVNENFTVTPNNQSQSEFRTLEEDQAYNQEWEAVNGPAYPDQAQEELAPLPESPAIPFVNAPADFAPQAPAEVAPLVDATNQAVNQAVVDANATMQSLVGLYN